MNDYIIIGLVVYVIGVVVSYRITIKAILNKFGVIKGSDASTIGFISACSWLGAFVSLAEFYGNDNKILFTKEKKREEHSDRTYYLHVSYCGTINNRTCSITGDVLLHIKNNSMDDVRNMIKDMVRRDEDVIIDKLPTITSLTEISKELYDILCDNLKENHG